MTLTGEVPQPEDFLDFHIVVVQQLPPPMLASYYYCY